MEKFLFVFVHSHPTGIGATSATSGIFNMGILAHQMASVPILQGQSLALEIAWIAGGCLSFISSMGMIIFMIIQIDWQSKHSIIKNFSRFLLFQLAVSNLLSAIFYLITIWKSATEGMSTCWHV
jgi:hypothetical protein